MEKIITEEYKERLLELSSDLKHFIEEQGFTKAESLSVEEKEMFLERVIYLCGFIEALKSC